MKKVSFVFFCFFTVFAIISIFFYYNPPIDQVVDGRTFSFLPILFLGLTVSTINGFYLPILCIVLVSSLFVSFQTIKSFSVVLLTSLIFGIGFSLWFAAFNFGIIIRFTVAFLILITILDLLRRIFNRIPASIPFVLSIFFLFIGLYASNVVYSDIDHVQQTALNSIFLSNNLSTIELEGGTYDVQKNKLYGLDLCAGFINNAYTNICQASLLRSVQAQEYVIATDSDNIPSDYCENYIRTVDNGSIEKYSFRYWGGLNACYKHSAKTLEDCEKIDTKLENFIDKWDSDPSDDRLQFQDLKQTCINLIKGGGTGADLH